MLVEEARMTAEERLKELVDDSYSRCRYCGLFHDSTARDCGKYPVTIGGTRVGEGFYEGGYIKWCRPNS